MFQAYCSTHVTLRTIRVDDDEVLHKKCRAVTEITEHIRLLLEDMAETMYTAGGFGLAANQVGVLRRLIVIDVGEGLMKLVNPEFVTEEGEQIVEEGCLSFPDVWGTVKRPARVVVRAKNEDGQEIIVEGTDMLAKCLCHEMDHLNGIVFMDKIIEYTE
ncbi:MAG: peptide deformylase [Christensenella sp.]